MKKLIFLIALLLFLIACHSTPRKPDLVANGKEFRFRESCVMSHDEIKFGYHYGYDFASGSYRWHFGNHSTTVCDSVKVDTIEINTDRKFYDKNGNPIQY